MSKMGPRFHRAPAPLLAFCFLLFTFCFPACTCKPAPAPKERQQPAVVLVDPDEAATVPATPEAEPNDSREVAQLLQPGEWISATMAKGESDWFKLSISQGAQVARAQVRGITGLDLRLEAYEAAGKRLVKVDNSKEGGGEVLVNLSVEPGTYYLRVSEVKGIASGTATYRVGYRLRAREEGEELEPNWKAALATPLAVDQEAVGYLGWATDTDWYRVDAAGISASARIRVELDGVDGVRAHLAVRDDGGKLLAERWTARGGEALLANLAPPAAGSDHFHVVVRCRKETNVETRYYLRVLAAVPPGPTEREPNDTAATATALTPGATLSGLLAYRRERDIYRIAAQETTWVAISARPPMGLDLELALVDEQGKALWTVNEAGLRLPEVMPALVIRPPGALVQVRAVALDQVSGDAPYVISARLLASGGMELEPNDAVANATGIWPEDQWPIRGYIHPAKDRDLYRLRAASSRLRLSFISPAGLALKGVLSAAQGGSSLAEVEAEPSGDESESVLEVDVIEGQEYLLEVSDPRGKGDAQQAYVIQRENP